MRQEYKRLQLKHHIPKEEKSYHLINKNGVWLQDRTEIGTHSATFLIYFSNSNPNDFNVLDDLFLRVINGQKNADLCQVPNPHQIKQALWSIQNLKALGSDDGMSTIFYKKHWNIIRTDIIYFVLEFFGTWIMNPDINFTLIIYGL